MSDYDFIREKIPDETSSTRLKDILGIELNYAGISQCKPGHLWSGIRTQYIIHFVLNGEGCLKVNSKTYDLSRNQAFIIYPGDYAAYWADHKNPWKYCWINFSGNSIESILSATAFSKSHRRIETQNISQVENLVLDFLKLENINQKNYLKNISNFFKMLSLLEPADACQYSHNIRRSHYLNALEFINKNYSMDITIEKTAQFIGLDRKYLSSLFKEFSGITPQQHLIAVRLVNAKNMLQTTNLSVSEIAFSSGYNDPSHFSKSFKGKYSLSPNEYKDSFVDENNENQ